ncbi:phosphohydrolase [Kiloniella spongiae]|uniref:5'-deoxynucleotidase n=1 Tax=Kiloniella spongiae TaxID=1489064 RepID=A0A0H2MGC2_9PROT|nr:HD domain-containing protein [Kiloniella spongiae]KLN61614.1 phosphohydrolase [Kiloniella spongiae]
MNKQDIAALLDFLRASEPLKSTLRSGYTASGRKESTAEHTWRLCLMALLLEDEYPELDMLKLLKICIVHDLGEVINGDIPAIDQSVDHNKNVQERNDLDEVTSVLPTGLKTKIMGLWDDYDLGRSEEAQLAKALDKLETVLQHTQGQNPEDFDYRFNLTYGKKQTDFDKNTRTIRRLIDQDTEQLSRRNKI